MIANRLPDFDFGLGETVDALRERTPTRRRMSACLRAAMRANT